jgi:hypothetical protein
VTVVYAVVLLVGVVLLLVWLVATAIGVWVEGWESFDPEARFGARGRAVVAGALGFGMGGLSATFAGWPAGLALLAAVAGSGAMALVSRLFGPEEAGA